MKKLTTLLVMLLFTAGMAIGQNNDATVDQEYDGNEALITQAGDLNTSTVDQSSDLGFNEGEGHLADIFQDGDENTATVVQDFLESVPSTLPHEARIDQIGDENTADVLQTRNQFSNFADIFQDGDENYAGVQQQDGATFDAVQDGDMNRIEGVTTDRAEQRSGNALASNSNVMDFTQIGDDNLIQARQFDTAAGGAGVNTATIMQDGDWNEVLMSQSNPGNTLNVNQNGSYNSTEITQSN